MEFSVDCPLDAGERKKDNPDLVAVNIQTNGY